MVLALLTFCCAACGGHVAATPPALGGPSPAVASVPSTVADPVERPIARTLRRWAARQGLHLDAIRCPAWDRMMPERLPCRAWFDGVPADVRVWLHAMRHGRVGFEARVLGSVLSTSRLEQRLRTQGYDGADCGKVPAYPVRVGMRLVCRVVRAGAASYVVATVTNAAGAVTITPR